MLNLNSFVAVQNNYSLIRREVEKELVPLAKAYNLGIMPSYPLASGFLTGKYKRGEPPPEGTRFVETDLAGGQPPGELGYRRCHQELAGGSQRQGR